MRELRYSNFELEKIFIGINEKSKIILSDLTRIDGEIFTLNYFRRNELWLGKSYIDLCYAIIPSKLFPMKPPVDEGVYIYNIANGNIVSPSVPFVKLLPASWPMTTLTNMYGNFGLFGVILGSFFNGWVLAKAYSLFLKNKENPLALIIYFKILLGFKLVNINILNTILLIILYLPIYFWFNKLIYKEGRGQNEKRYKCYYTNV
jgi:hypothetical protein